MKRVVFADTFYFIALLDSSDASHAKAVAWSRQLQLTFVTTEYVLLELADAFHLPGDRAEFVELYDALRTDPVFRVLPSNKTLYASGVALYSRRKDKSWQLTDCISFAAMKKYRIRDALTGDRHFEQAGFNALLK